MMFREYKKITKEEMEGAIISLGFLDGYVGQTLDGLHKQARKKQENFQKKYKKFDPNEKGSKKEDDFYMKLVVYMDMKRILKKLLSDFAAIMQETNDFLSKKEAVLYNDRYMFPTDVSLEKYTYLDDKDSYSYGTIMMGIMVDEFLSSNDDNQVSKSSLMSIRNGFRKVTKSTVFGDCFKGKNKVSLALLKLGAFFGISFCKEVLQNKEIKEIQSQAIEEIPLRFLR